MKEPSQQDSLWVEVPATEEGSQRAAMWAQASSRFPKAHLQMQPVYFIYPSSPGSLLGVLDHMGSAVTTQLCHCRVKADRDNT